MALLFVRSTIRRPWPRSFWLFGYRASSICGLLTYSRWGREGFSMHRDAFREISCALRIFLLNSSVMPLWCITHWNFTTHQRKQEMKVFLFFDRKITFWLRYFDTCHGMVLKNRVIATFQLVRKYGFWAWKFKVYNVNIGLKNLRR